MLRVPLVALCGLLGLFGCDGSPSSTGVPNPPEPTPAPTTTATTTPSMVPNPGDPPNSCAIPSAPAGPAALLTRAEYDNTVADLLGDTSRPAAAFPPENQIDGFNNNVIAHQASPLLVEKYLEAAEALAAARVARGLDDIAACPAGSDELVCGEKFVRTFGQSAFRRPLQPLELQIFDGLFQRSYAASGYAFGVELVMTAILQSPQFLYRTQSRRDPPVPESGAVPLDPFDLASRLSYFLTSSMPDPELFNAASMKMLGTQSEIAMHARRLLATERAKQMVRDFHQQWLRLDSLPSLARLASDLGPQAMQVGPDLLGSLNRFVDHVYFESGKVADLFSSKRVYVSPALAALYGATPPASDFVAVEMPDRAGLLTQPALLTLLAHPDQTAPVLRGVFVRQRMMCLEVPPPPPGANTTPPDPDPSATTRERFRQHTASTECSLCHRLFDGIGFGLEAYDQLGRFRTTENGSELDTSGEIWGSGAVGIDGAFNGAAELSARLDSSQAVRDCLAGTWYGYAMGRDLTASDACSLEQVKRTFNETSGDLRELLVAIATSDGFRNRAPIPEDMP